MTRLLILVHGMGSNAAGWSDELVARLDALASRYSAFQGNAAALSQRCVIKEVCYDGIFERYVSDWSAAASNFAAFQKKHAVALPTLTKWLTSTTLPSDQKNAFWSTLIDPILYRGFPLVRDEVRNTVMTQIVGHCTAQMSAGAVQVSILAHSLGTAVVHDTLQLLASTPQLGNDSFTAQRGWHFENLFMLADVCRLGPPALLDLKDSAQGYLVRPRSAGKPGDVTSFYCNEMFSFRHEIDPFVRWAPFAPQGWGVDFVSPDPLTAIHQANVHGFGHYLNHPAVHVPIINGLLGGSVIRFREYLDAIANYPERSVAACAPQINELRAMISAWTPVGDDLEDIAIRGSQFIATAQRLAKECVGLAGGLNA